jgi:hypothetical protein
MSARPCSPGYIWQAFMVDHGTGGVDGASTQYPRPVAAAVTRSTLQRQWRQQPKAVGLLFSK